MTMDVDVKIVDGAAAVAAGEVTAATLGGTLGWDSALFFSVAIELDFQMCTIY